MDVRVSGNIAFSYFKGWTRILAFQFIFSLGGIGSPEKDCGLCE